MALLDEEETDWKVIVIDHKDPLAPKLNGTHWSTCFCEPGTDWRQISRTSSAIFLVF